MFANIVHLLFDHVFYNFVKCMLYSFFQEKGRQQLGYNSDENYDAENILL